MRVVRRHLLLAEMARHQQEADMLVAHVVDMPLARGALVVDMLALGVDMSLARGVVDIASRLHKACRLLLHFFALQQ